MIENNIYNKIKEIDTEEMAQKIYNYNCDMDFQDYEETKEKEIEEIENTLYFLKTIALNEYNKNNYKTFIIALKNLIENL